MQAKNGQTIIQYAALIIIIVGAFMVMRPFITRSIQEKYRDTADVFGQGRTYAKGVTQVTSLDGSAAAVTATNVAGRRSCADVSSDVASLRNQIIKLQGVVDDIENNATDSQGLNTGLTGDIQSLRSNIEDMLAQAGYNETLAAQARQEADNKMQQADQVQEEIDQIKKDNPECVRGSMSGECFRIPQLQLRIVQLQREANVLVTQAVDLEGRAADLRRSASSLTRAANGLESGQDSGTTDRIGAARGYAGDIKEEIKAKEEQIQKYKTWYPDCSL